MPHPRIVENAPRFTVSELADILEHLLGRVFHVTRLSHLESIQAAGALLPNTTGVASPFGDAGNGYFRARKCVSFFDFRDYQSEGWKKFHGVCSPTNAISPDDPAIVMFLAPEHHSKLIPWTEWQATGMKGSMVPYIEMGFPGAVNLDMFEEAHVWDLADAENRRKFDDAINAAMLAAAEKKRGIRAD